MKKLNRAVIIISRIVEVFMWVGCGLSVIITALSAAGKFGALKYFTNAGQGSPYLTNGNFVILGTNAAGEPSRGAYVIFFLTLVVVFALMAMIARNVYLVFKTSEGRTRFSKGETPFQPDNVRMVREIGIFAIAIQVAEIVMAIIARVALGPDAVEASMNMEGIFFGLVVLALSQFFAYGMKLESDVDGLL